MHAHRHTELTFFRLALHNVNSSPGRGQPHALLPLCFFEVLCPRIDLVTREDPGLRSV